MTSKVASAEDWEYPEGDLAASVPVLPPEPPEPTPPVAPRRHWVTVAKPRAWYGTEIFVADAVTISLTTVGLALASRNASLGKDSDGTVALLGYGSYAVTAPTIHGVHSRWGMSVASLSMRIGLPIMGLFYGASSGHCPNDSDALFCGTTLATDVGLLSGMALASVLDAGLFAWDNREYELREASSIGIAPAFSAANKSGELRVFGTF